MIVNLSAPVIDLSLVRANRRWLAEEAPYAERVFASKKQAAASIWRRLAQERLAARNAANTPW